MANVIKLGSDEAGNKAIKVGKASDGDSLLLLLQEKGKTRARAGTQWYRGRERVYNEICQAAL